jgi:O-antigen ligase
MGHLWLDFRTLGGVCILIGFVLTARSITRSRLRSLYITVLLLALLLTSISIGYIYSTTNASFSERREGSNSQRLSMALAGVNAIKRSPIFGLGSWVWDAGMWNVYAGMVGRRTLSLSVAGETLGPHSQLIQAWAEAGVLGVLFFVYFGKLLIQALWTLFFHGAIDNRIPLFLLFLLGALWDLGCSPFANLHRLNIALALVITIHVLEAKRARRTVLQPGEWTCRP